MKTDKELDQEIYERQDRIKAAVHDGWRRLVNQGRAAYEKNGKYLDMNGNPCASPKPEKKQAGRPKKVEPVIEETPEPIAYAQPIEKQ